MPIHIAWNDHDQTILLLDFDDVWSWDDFSQADHLIRAQLDSVDHSVDIILDATTMVVPADMLSHFRDVTRTASLTHPTVRENVYILPTRFLQSLGDLFVRLFGEIGDKLVMVHSMEEALQYLQTRDNTD